MGALCEQFNELIDVKAVRRGLYVDGLLKCVLVFMSVVQVFLNTSCAMWHFFNFDSLPFALKASIYKPVTKDAVTEGR